MTQLLELYKCKVCDNIVEIARCGVGNLVCCDEAMKLIEEQIAPVDDAHFAHIEKLDEISNNDGYLIEKPSTNLKEIINLLNSIE